MYSTCLFCNQPLGNNESIETFPIGRRLAFDAERGRLWVVCRKCERWNLSSLEERWEAMESCERLFSATRTRVSTEQIGLARLGEGLELIRIGRPMRPEFAAWRYGDQFGRRRRRAILVGTGVAAAVGGVVVGGMIAGVIGGGILAQSGNIVNWAMNSRTRLRLRRDNGRVLKLKNSDLSNAHISTTGTSELALSIGQGKRREVFIGDEAERVTSIIMPKLNTMGGNKEAVRTAVSQIETRGGPDAFLKATMHGGIAGLPKPTRLAIEMSLHEERERRALEGELQVLEEAWRQAEEIAAISDDLLVAPGMRERLADLKAGGKE